MTLTAPGCPVAGEMPQWVENAIMAVEGVEKVVVDMVFDPPWDLLAAYDSINGLINGVFVDRFKGDSTPPSPIPLPAFGVDDLKDEVEAVPVANGDDVFELIGIFVISTRSMAGDDRSLERCPAFFRSAI